MWLPEKEIYGIIRTGTDASTGRLLLGERWWHLWPSHGETSAASNRASRAEKSSCSRRRSKGRSANAPAKSVALWPTRTTLHLPVTTWHQVKRNIYILHVGHCGATLLRSKTELRGVCSSSKENHQTHKTQRNAGLASQTRPRQSSPVTIRVLSGLKDAVATSVSSGETPCTTCAAFWAQLCWSEILRLALALNVLIGAPKHWNHWKYKHWMTRIQFKSSKANNTTTTMIQCTCTCTLRRSFWSCSELAC